MSVYQSCAAAHGSELHLLIQCVSSSLETEAKNQAVNSPGFVAAEFVNVKDVTDWLLVLTGALAFFMQAGFAMVCAGAIRKKNVNNTVSVNCATSFFSITRCNAGFT
jgi:hypothetical protein